MSRNAPRPPASRQPLFREEVSREYARRLWGEIILTQPLTARLLTPVVAAGLLAVGLFLTSQSYTRTETVPGYVAASVGVSKLIPPRPGSVSEVFVEVGDPVRRGQVLLTASSDASLPGGGALSETLLDELLEQRGELEQKLRASEILHSQARARAAERAGSVRAQLAELRAQLELTVGRCQIADEKTAVFATLLARGIVSAIEHRDRRDVALSLHAERRRLEALRIERREELRSIESEIAGAPLRERRELADLRLSISQISSRIREIESQASYAIEAPVAGRIAALQVAPGTALRPQVPAAVVLPEGGLLEAHLLVPTRAMGFLEPGQRVGLRYAAFPYQRFGVQAGQIARVDTAVLGPGELESPLEIREPVYRVTVELEQQQVRAYEAWHPLQLGMLLEAEIALEERSLLQWLLEPLHSLRGAS